MWKRVFSQIGLVLIVLGEVNAAELTPLNMIQTAYDQISQDKWVGAGDPAEVRLAPVKLTANWFTARFIGALYQDSKCWEAGKEGIGPVWYDGQDSSIKDLNITKKNETANAQTIHADFTNNGRAESKDFLFKNGVRGWRIDDIIDGKQSLFEQMAKGCPGQ